MMGWLVYYNWKRCARKSLWWNFRYFPGCCLLYNA